MKQHIICISLVLLCLFSNSSLADDELAKAIELWSGEWETNYGKMVLDFDKEGRFKGYYGGSKHALRGRLDEDDPRILTGSWKHTGSTSNGLIRFQLSEDGKSFKGSYTSGETIPSASAVNWIGKRTGASQAKWKKGEKPIWSGNWTTTYGDLVLIDKGDGRFQGAYGPLEHSVWGTVDKENPRVLHGRWKHTNSDWTGRFSFQLDEPNHFKGQWTSGTTEPSISNVNWEGSRKASTIELKNKGSER